MIERLTSKEVQSLTARKRHSSQFEVLRKMGITCEPDGDGRPVVLRSHVEAVLGSGETLSAVREVEPNWSAVR